MLIMMCLTQDNLEKQKSGSDLNVQHTEMVKKNDNLYYLWSIGFQQGCQDHEVGEG